MVAIPALRIVFFGTPEFALPALDALLHSSHCVVGVVTQPDRPRGRGQKTTHAPVKARAVSAGLPVLQPDRLKSPAFLQALAALAADLGVVAAYGRILTETVLSTPRLGMVNVHASLLPRYRGAAPVHRAVIAGEPVTGVTIMRVVQALDAGPMLATRTRPIGAEESSDDVERDLARLGADLLRSTVDELAAGLVTATPQDESRATYAPRLTKDDGIVDWSWSAERIHNLIRGLHPWPHAFAFLNGQRLILLRSTAVVGAQSDVAPGTIVEATGDRLRVSAGGGVIQLEEIQTAGKRPMRARDFLTGHHVAPGARFTPGP
jgi:methionyl-tRNA formyltransferase